MFEEPGVASILRFQNKLRDRIRLGIQGRSKDELSRVQREEADDSVFVIDQIAENELIELLETEICGFGEVRVTAEGLGEELRLNTGGPGRHHMILDPIDGSRVLAWDKRSAFILTALAVDQDGAETLEDIVMAAQTEIPTSRSDLSDQLVAMRGEGALGRTINLRSGEERRFEPLPSQSSTVQGGFGSLVRFFAPGRELLARIDDLLIEEIGGSGKRPLVFEDQYLSTGGLIYQMATGRDRFVADLRPRLARHLERRGLQAPLCSHPYDLASILVARESGAMVTSDQGGPLNQVLDRLGRVGFIAYANEEIRRIVEAPLLRIAAEVLGDA